MSGTHRSTAIPGATRRLGERLDLRRVAKIGPTQFVVFVALAAAASIVVPPTWTTGVDRWLPAFVALTILSVGLEFVAVDLPFDGDLSVATISHVALIVLVPHPFAAIAVGSSILVEQLVHRRGLAKLVFNTTGYVLTASVVSLPLGIAGHPWNAAADHDNLRLLGIFLIAAVGYYLVNTLIVSGIIAVATGRSFRFVFKANIGNTFLAEIGAATIGGLLALLWTVEPLWTVLLALPGAVISRALRYIRQLETETKLAVRTLAQAIDHRDRSTYHHSERVSVYARALAEELEVDDDLVELIAEAAAVHDLGKIGIPDRVLLKPGPLTEAERTLMWLHTEIGARILGQFALFRPGVAIVLHHHERYDGQGYPRRLKGEAIPLGARVVAVADAFDAMTEDRPYRRALDLEEATKRLRDGSGTQWDPMVVGAFLRMAAENRLPKPEFQVDHDDPAFIAPENPAIAGGRAIEACEPSPDEAPATAA